MVRHVENKIKKVFRFLRFRVTRQGNWCLKVEDSMDEDDEKLNFLKAPKRILSRKKSHQKTNTN